MAVVSQYTIPAAQGYGSVAPFGTPGVPGLGALTTPWVDLGGVTQDGLVENPGQTRTDWKRWGSIAPYNSIITDEKKEFSIKFLESNVNVLGLVHRAGGPLVPTGAGTSEVQTITITGTPTGGTFSLTFGGQTTPALAYNATASVVQAALQALSSIGSGNATVAGSAGGPYTVTFAGVLANTNVVQILPVGTFTGGTTPAITTTTTTPGAVGSLLSLTDDTAGVRDLRAMTFDIITGTNHIRFYCPQAEVTNVANTPYKFDAPIIYDVTITAYPNSSGVSVKRDWLLDAVVQGL
ncbi:MAG: LigA protein [Streptosporangiaceae bacterium]|nr:LigA protein [Streptosporangiaceae bacterium]